MLILSLDSTALTATVALCDNDKPLAIYSLQNGNTHSETLLPMVESILNAFSLSPDDLQLFACTAGPGSFTGVRIGVSTIKGLAFSTQIPCIGVSTLEALAYNLIGFDGLFCPVMNARRSQVYCALFRCQNGILTRLCQDCAMSVSELDLVLAQTETDLPIYLCGDGYDITLAALQACTPRLRKTPMVLRSQNAYSVAQVARAHYESGIRTTDIELSPVYLRPCQAERERMERLSRQKI